MLYNIKSNPELICKCKKYIRAILKRFKALLHLSGILYHKRKDN